jgi:hypothetical protein
MQICDALLCKLWPILFGKKRRPLPTVSHQGFLPLVAKWVLTKDHIERASSYNSSGVFEKDIENLLSMTPPAWKKKNKENMKSPPGLDTSDVFRDSISKRKGLSKSKSQPRVAATKCRDK